MYIMYIEIHMSLYNVYIINRYVYLDLHKIHTSQSAHRAPSTISIRAPSSRGRRRSVSPTELHRANKKKEERRKKEEGKKERNMF